MSINRKDTPLEKTPDVKKTESTLTNLGSALSDIQKRAQARQKVIYESKKKIDEAKMAAKEKGRRQTGSGKLQGLLGLKNTLGMQYYKET